MATRITFTATDGKDYTLEFNADSIKNLEKGGFNFSDLSSHVLTAPEDLFVAAFNMHHKDVRVAKRKELYAAMCGFADQTSIAEALYTMLAEATEKIAPAGNVAWKME